VSLGSGGDLAIKVDTNYGEQDLQKFCQERGWEYDTVRRQRDVAKAYPQSARQRALSFELAKTFAAQPDRLDLIASRDDWTVRQARDAESYRAAR